MNRIRLLGPFLLLIVFVPAFAQTNVNEEQGMKPYDSWHGGDLDSISMTNRGMMLHIPLVCFAQRGTLDLCFSIYSNTKNWQAVTYCVSDSGDPTGWNCNGTKWEPLPRGGLLPKTPPGIKNPPNYSVDGAYVASSQDYWFQAFSQTEPIDPNNPPNQTIYDWAQNIVAPDGNTHLLASAAEGSIYGGPSYPLRSLDATGMLAPDGQTLILPNGTRFSFVNGRSPQPLNTAPSSITDANGNQITINSTTGAITDTMGRVIPALPGTGTSDLSHCPAGTASANIWTVPGVAGVNNGTRSFKFCYSNFTIYTNFATGATEYPSTSTPLLSGIVLPDLTVWTLSYDNYGDVASLGFPTGGSISYTYLTNQICGSYGTQASLAATSRTVNANDGTGNHTWTYTYSGQVSSTNNYSGTTIVTSPDGNDVVHTITNPVAGQACSLFDTQAQYYQGSHTSGTLLKTVAIQYTGAVNQMAPDQLTAINVVATQVTNTWPGGHVSKVVNTWDSGNTETPYYGLTVPVVLGSVLQRDEYDFSNSLARSTLNHYLWQDNSSYKTNNILGPLVSTTVKDGSGNQVAQTTYGIDQTAVTSSGITTGHVSPPAGGNIRGNVTTASHWLNTNNSFISGTATYFDTGMKASSTDPLNNTTTYSYSSSFVGAYVTQTNMPDTGSTHHVISGNYDFNTGLLTSFTDENSQTFTYSYDIMLRLLQGNHPDGGQTIFTYPDPNTVTRKRLITSGNYEGLLTAKFDGLGRTYQTQQVTPSGTALVDTTYDSVGRVSTVSNPYFSGSNHSTDPTYGIVTTQYDALSRVTTTIKQDGSSATITYADNCTTATDEAGKKRKVCSDALGRMTNVWEDPSALNYETDYQYDTVGNMLRVDQKGSASGDSTQWRTRLFSYDSLSRLLTANNPESGTITYSYDAVGNLLQKTSPAPNQTGSGTQVISYCYDSLNRLTGKAYSAQTCSNGQLPTGTAASSFVYDEVASWVSNTIGRLTTATTSTGGVAHKVYSYDQMGRVNKIIERTTGEQWVGNATASYDLAGNLVSLGYPSGRVVTLGYNSADQLDQVTLDNVSGTPVGYSYWSVNDSNFYANGTPKLVTLGNGVTEATALNKRLQLSEDTVTNGSIGTLADHAYSYGTQGTNNGNILSVADQLNSGRTQSFSYDSLNRLQTANESRWGLSFVYDSWGNRLQQNVTSGSASQMVYTVDGKNRIAGAPSNCTVATEYCYDLAGNMLNDGFHNYVFDAESRIRNVDSGNATYTYDAGGNRVRKDISGQPSTEYIYFGGQMIAERNVNTGFWTDYVYANGKRIAQTGNHKEIINTYGTQCSNCGWQWNIFWLPGNLDNHGYVIRAGDKLVSWQWSSSTARGGLLLWFTDGTYTYAATDQDGQASNNDTMTQIWHYRRIDLSAYAGKTISGAGLDTEGYTPAGDWSISYTDMALMSTDGTVWSFYNGQSSMSLTIAGAQGSTRNYGIIDQSGYGWPTMSAVYYHGDQIGSSRLMTSYNGYPIWQGTFLPYGEEYSPQITSNHYKFSGKEWDTESNLDYFGARYYGNSLGRFLTPDWAAKPTSVPYAHFGDPQSLNLYSYVRNSPIINVDADGHSGNFAGYNGMHADTTGGITELDYDFDFDVAATGGAYSERAYTGADSDVHPGQSNTAGAPPQQAAPDLKGPYVADLKSPQIAPLLDPNHESSMSDLIGDGQCVTATKKWTGMDKENIDTSQWRQGPKVAGNSTIQPGTAIATFDSKGRYPGKGVSEKNSGIYLGSGANGIIYVLDQWPERGSRPARPPAPRELHLDSRRAPSDNADAYYVIMVAPR